MRRDGFQARRKFSAKESNMAIKKVDAKRYPALAKWQRAVLSARSNKDKVIRVQMPDIADACQHCGRTLDGRFNSPFGAWSIPTYTNGRTYCGYCSELVTRGWDARKELKPCPALESLELWLAQPSPIADR